MDYVVFGIGFGATLLVLGLVIRDFGPHVRHRKSTDPQGIFHAEELVARVSWSRFCGALGTMLAIGGALVLVATVVSMYFRLSDETGGWVMAGSLVTLIVIVAFWTWAFFDRFGSYGILPEKDQAISEVTRPDEPPPAGPTRIQPEGHDRDSSQVEAETSSKTGDQDTGQRGSAEATTPDRPTITPEERLARSESALDHDSHEADLGVPMRSSHRSDHRGQPDRPPSRSDPVVGPKPPPGLGHRPETSEEEEADTSHTVGLESEKT